VILVTGITGTRNRGVEAILAPTLTRLRELAPRTRIVVMTGTPDYDAWRLAPYRVEVRPSTFGGGGAVTELRRRASTRLRPLARGWRRGVDLVREASLVIAGGGDVFSSDYGTLDEHLAPLRVALEHDVPVAFLAQSIGPFRNDGEAERWLEVGRRASLLTVREPLTQAYLSEGLGLGDGHVQRTADPAFLLEPQTAGALAGFYGLEGPLVAVCPSQGIGRYAGLDADGHRDRWAGAIRWLLDELGVRVALVPHVRDASVAGDDLVSATEIARRLDFDARLTLVGGEHSAAELKALLTRAQLIVTERMHAAIAGLSGAVATVPIGYSVKARGIVADALPDRSPDELVLGVERLADPGVFEAHVGRVWEERERVATELRAQRPRLRAAAARNFELLAPLVRE
jgi:colanic acid/amylovoran biosynthesis protein